MTDQHGHDRLQATRACIGRHSARIPDPGFKIPTDDVRALMARCGFKDVNRFRDRRAAWDSVAEPIPLNYLDAIGVARDALKDALMADMDRFHEALSKPVKFDRYRVRHFAAFYGQGRFPFPLVEDDAVAVVRKKARSTGLHHALMVPGLKALFIDPDGTLNVRTYPPVHQWGPRTLSFGRGGHLVSSAPSGSFGKRNP